MGNILIPSHESEIIIDGFTQKQLIALIVEAVSNLDWEASYIFFNGLLGSTSSNPIFPGEDITIKLTGNKINIESSSENVGLSDLGQNKRNIKNFINCINTLSSSIDRTKLDEIYMNLETTIGLNEQDLMQKENKAAKFEWNNILNLFIPREDYYITPILIILNILIYLIVTIKSGSFSDPSNEILIKFGANFKPYTLSNGEYWRLLTSTFLHGGLLHLLMNMYALIYIGVLLEPLMGKRKYLLYYLLTGVLASTSSLFWHEFTVSVGASGAIFGLYGIFLALLTTNLIEKTARNSLFSSIGLFVVFNLIYGFKGNIDNAAHIGGLISGFILGYYFFFTLRFNEIKKMSRGSDIILIVATISLLISIIGKIPDTYSIYEKKMVKFEQLEKEALQFYSATMPTQKDSLDQLDVGIMKWKECKAIIESLKIFGFPKSIDEKNKKLIKYSELRIETYELFQEALIKGKIDVELFNSKYRELESIINSD